MRKIPRISETEWEVMKIVWSQAPCSAGEIIAALRQTDPSWHPRTAKAFLNRLRVLWRPGKKLCIMNVRPFRTR